MGFSGIKTKSKMGSSPSKVRPRLLEKNYRVRLVDVYNFEKLEYVVEYNGKRFKMTIKLDINPYVGFEKLTKMKISRKATKQEIKKLLSSKIIYYDVVG